MIYQTSYWAGQNDYYYNLALALVASIVVKSLIKEIHDLIQIGAKHILIVNLPPFDAYPAT
ncbi:unnamed protein product, partial [Rotaria sp. Silwood1]